MEGKRCAQIGEAEVGLAQVCFADVGETQVGLLQIAARRALINDFPNCLPFGIHAGVLVALCVMERRESEVGIAQDAKPEVRATQAGRKQSRRIQIGKAQIGVGQSGETQVGVQES